MMNIQQKRDLLMSLPLMEQEQRWIMERLDTLSVKEQYHRPPDPPDRRHRRGDPWADPVAGCVRHRPDPPPTGRG